MYSQFLSCKLFHSDLTQLTVLEDCMKSLLTCIGKKGLRRGVVICSQVEVFEEQTKVSQSDQ